MEESSPLRKIKMINRLSNSYSFRLIENKQNFILSLTKSSNNMDISNDSNSQSRINQSESIEDIENHAEENKYNYITTKKNNGKRNNFQLNFSSYNSSTQEIRQS